MLPTDNHLEGEVSLSPAAHLADTGTGSDWENGEGWHCPVLQQLGEGDHLALQHCSSYQWMSMNDARLAMSMQHKYWAMFMFIHNYPNKTLCRQSIWGTSPFLIYIPFIPHWVQWRVLGSDGLSEQPSRQLRRPGFFNLDIRVLWYTQHLDKKATC